MMWANLFMWVTGAVFGVKSIIDKKYVDAIIFFAAVIYNTPAVIKEIKRYFE